MVNDISKDGIYDEKAFDINGGGNGFGCGAGPAVI